jgi:hypothetical protein
MEARHIPGFYYGKGISVRIKGIILTHPDAEKKKYFKVQPERLAPAGTKYTLENVRKEKEETKVCALTLCTLFHLSSLFLGVQIVVHDIVGH